MKGKRQWIIVADGARARFFQTANRGRTLTPALDRELIADNRAGREIMADRPGRVKDRMTPGRHAMEPPTDPREAERIELAREVAEVLDAERKRGGFDELILIAPPKMLGLIREALSDETRARVGEELAKDFSKLDARQLGERLQPVL